jgi:hypothetical protein
LLVAFTGRALLATITALGILSALTMCANFPLASARYVGMGQPHDNEFTVIELDRSPGIAGRR